MTENLTQMNQYMHALQQDLMQAAQEEEKSEKKE